LINVGIAGLGKMGKLHYMNAIRNDDVNVVAVADLRKSNLSVVEKSKIKKYVDYKEMIEKENLDAIILSLPNFLKKEGILNCAEKDLAIFVDKPLCRNFKEADEVVREISEKNLELMVGVNYRYFDCVEKVKHIVEEGNIGDVVLGTSELIMDGPFSHPLVPAPVAEWWFDKERSGGGALLDLGYHLLDLLQWFFGGLEVEFSALKYRYNLDIEDAATVVLKSREGVRCTLNVGWFSKMLFPNFNFRLNFHGTVGYVSTDDYTPSNLYIHAMKEGLKNFFKRLMFQKPDYLSYTYYYSSFTRILSQFFDSVENGFESPVNLDDQLSILKCIDDVYNKGGVSG
jgi:predicted dehydrogenase